jgi:hypothetical protein
MVYMEEREGVLGSKCGKSEMVIELRAGGEQR